MYRWGAKIKKFTLPNIRKHSTCRVCPREVSSGNQIKYSQSLTINIQPRFHCSNRLCKRLSVTDLQRTSHQMEFVALDGVRHLVVGIVLSFGFSPFKVFEWLRVDLENQKGGIKEFSNLSLLDQNWLPLEDSFLYFAKEDTASYQIWVGIYGEVFLLFQRACLVPCLAFCLAWTAQEKRRRRRRAGLAIGDGSWLAWKFVDKLREGCARTPHQRCKKWSAIVYPQEKTLSGRKVLR